MLKNSIVILLSVICIGAFSGCKKETYSFGEIKTPTAFAVTTTVTGTDAANPNGNGSGSVNISATSKDAITYKIDFGDGASGIAPNGITTHKYTTPGINNYTITVNAIGTGGAMSTISKRVTVFVAFKIPAAIIDALTGGSSRTWVSDRNAPGHFGVGPADGFSPIWYSAEPNQRAACVYDDEITFTKTADDGITITVDNKGTSFLITAATVYYGFSGSEGCFPVNTGGTKLLGFSDATSNSTPAQSSRVQFAVPGNGIVNIGTGGTTYEILSYSATNLHLRNIGIDGNAWYLKLTVK